MALDDPREARAAFLRSFKQLAPEKHRFDVWRDFITMAACALHNGLHKDEAREAEYLEIIGRYQSDDQQMFPQLLAHVVTMLDAEPRDILGPLYMELEIANKDAGQFFTPPELSEMMARLTFNEELDKLDTQPFITVHEPACGAGGMILALVKVMIEAGHNPTEKLWVQCIDVDRLAALMCYIQLTLWNVPADVIVGNTLSMELREVWYTPAHHLGFWDSKLKRADDNASLQEPEPETDVAAKAETPNHKEFRIDWHGQALAVRFCATWLGDDTAHLEIVSSNGEPHPISETGYRSHFVNIAQIEEAGGPVAYVESWLRAVDDGSTRQLSLF